MSNRLTERLEVQEGGGGLGSRRLELAGRLAGISPLYTASSTCDAVVQSGPLSLDAGRAGTGHRVEELLRVAHEAGARRESPLHPPSAAPPLR
jgi:hypothetical protein